MTRADMRRWLAATDRSRPARAVFLTLALHADGAGDAWPSVSTVARESGWGTTLVRLALRELEDAGDVERRDSRRGLPVVYRVNLNTRPLTQPQHPSVEVVVHNPNGNGANLNTRPLVPQHPSVAEGNYLQLQKGAAAGVDVETLELERDALDWCDPAATLSAERAALVELERRRAALPTIQQHRRTIIAGYRKQPHGGTMTDTPTTPNPDQPQPDNDPIEDPNDPQRRPDQPDRDPDNDPQRQPSPPSQ